MVKIMDVVIHKMIINLVIIKSIRSMTNACPSARPGPRVVVDGILGGGDVFCGIILNMKFVSREPKENGCIVGTGIRRIMWVLTNIAIKSWVQT